MHSTAKNQLKASATMSTADEKLLKNALLVYKSVKPYLVAKMSKGATLKKFNVLEFEREVEEFIDFYHKSERKFYLSSLRALPADIKEFVKFNYHYEEHSWKFIIVSLNLIINTFEYVEFNMLNPRNL